jgi:hypothetical protein
MNDVPENQAEVPQALLLSRRTFVASAATLAGAATTALVLIPAPCRGADGSETRDTAAKPTTVLTAVVGFHADRTYLDATGTAEPYRPPAGLRSGQTLAELSEVELLSRYPYLF